ncbi:MAG: hypothetical protein ACRERU_14515, partial [Methylococcales bacterium]
QQAFADGALADSTGYQLKMLAEELEGEPLASEAKRLVSRRDKDKRGGLGKRIHAMLNRPGTDDATARTMDTVAAKTALEQLERELLAARWLDAHTTIG